MTQHDAEAFLSSYADAFAQFDAELIADHLDIPLTIVNPTATAVNPEGG